METQKQKNKLVAVFPQENNDFFYASVVEKTKMAIKRRSQVRPNEMTTRAYFKLTDLCNFNLSPRSWDLATLEYFKIKAKENYKFFVDLHCQNKNCNGTIKT